MLVSVRVAHPSPSIPPCQSGRLTISGPHSQTLARLCKHPQHWPSVVHFYNADISDPSGALSFSGKAVLHASGVDFSSGSSYTINMQQLQLFEDLGKGTYGVVKRVLHKPTNVAMAMKVCIPATVPCIS